MLIMIWRHGEHGKGADAVFAERYREVQATGCRLSTRQGCPMLSGFHLILERAVSDRDHNVSVFMCMYICGHITSCLTESQLM
jgi:hypothetical protein